MVAPAVIAAGASLLGGIFGSNSERKAIAAQNEYNNPSNVRRRAEDAGFNPLLFVGPGVGQQVATGGSNFMGSAVANAGLALADGMDKAKMMEIERSKLAMDRQRLDALLNNATIRPKVAGIYASTVSAPLGVGVVSPPLHDQDFKSATVPAATIWQDYITSSGDVVSAPVGPDIDELVSGAAIAGLGYAKSARNLTSEDLLKSSLKFASQVWSDALKSNVVASDRRRVWRDALAKTQAENFDLSRVSPRKGKVPYSQVFK